MPRQLDILALEPYHGGARRAMLDALSRCSRHRWTLLKLPARRFERRQLVAATWFAEHLSRNEIGNVDVVFSSEALNLADFLRLRPDLARRPSVVYFHDNQLPDPLNGRLDTPTDLVNLNSATAASEIWFNSLYNLRTFLSRASGLVARHPELHVRNPLPSLTGKAHLVPPPIDLAFLNEMSTTAVAAHKSRNPDEHSLVVDARGADPAVLIEAITPLAKRKQPLKLTVIGRLKGLPASIRHAILGDRDEHAHLKSLLAANVFLGTRVNASSDDLAVRALALGCLPVVPDVGVYPELLPEVLHTTCLHDGTAESMTARILDAWYVDRDAGLSLHLDKVLEQFEAIRACRNIDERLDALAGVMKLKTSAIARNPATVA